YSVFLFFFSSRRRHTRFSRDWSSDVCSSDLSGTLNEEVLISRKLADRLQLKLGDRFNSFFLKDGDPSQIPNNRRFDIVGIYDSEIGRASCRERVEISGGRGSGREEDRER